MKWTQLPQGRYIVFRAPTWDSTGGLGDVLFAFDHKKIGKRKLRSLEQSSDGLGVFEVLDREKWMFTKILYMSNLEEWIETLD